MKNLKIPKCVKLALSKLEKNNFDAFVVGGCVRDTLLEKKPNDWDITTKATPKQVLWVFPDGKYENKFGTVIVPDKYLSELKVISREVSITSEQIDELIEIAKKKYLSKIKCKRHGLLHSQNVVKNAVFIASDFKCINDKIIELIVTFHDTGRAIKGKKSHIIKGQEVFEIEMQTLDLEKKTIKFLKEAINHNYDVSRKSFEAQILLEADLIDSLSIERINLLEDEAKTQHNGWLKDHFNKEGVFKEIITKKGSELMHDSINCFNKQSDLFKIPQIKLIEGENIEITTYRIESKYSDKRHPDGVIFAKTLQEDLSRRDFTINAMAIKLGDIGKKENKEISKEEGYKVIDLFDGQKDLENKTIRAVGDPDERFQEDALRMLRAVRFAVVLGFEIEKETKKAIIKRVYNMSFVSLERIRDEFEKIILSNHPEEGIELLVETGLMKYIMPEVVQTISIKQNHHHYYGPYNTVYKHLVASLAKCPSKKLEVRLAAFLHDIGKPAVKEGIGEKSTFYNHEHVGAKITNKILRRLKFPRQIIEKTTLLVKNHMFYYNVDEVGEAGVRRVIGKVGIDNINDLIDVRVGDRLGSGVPKAIPYKLRHFQYMVEKVSKDPISVKQLKINGNDIIKELKIKPSPQIGAILEVLLVKVIKDPKINEKQQLIGLAKKLKDKNLNVLRRLARKKIGETRKEEDKKTKEKHWVK